MAPKILVIMTSHSKMGDSGKPTGWYLPELSHPYDVFVKAGAEMTFVSPKGGVSPLDPASVEMFKSDPSAANFLENHKEIWENTKPLSDFTGAADTFDAVFVPGGHGPMYDLYGDKTSQKIIGDFASRGKVVAAVCHGPAALINVTLSDGTPLLRGKQCTGFSNVEEDQVQLTPYMPFLMETELGRVSGGKYVKASEPWGENVVVSGNVITGQNPSSAHKIAEEVIKALKA